MDDAYVRIKDNGLGFYFLLFFMVKLKTKKTKCDIIMVTEVTCSHDVREQYRRFWINDIITIYSTHVSLKANT